MGKHKGKSKKHKKDKKCKKQRKDYSSSSEEEWVEKKIDNESSSEEERIEKKSNFRRKKYSSEEDSKSSSSSEDEKRNLDERERVSYSRNKSQFMKDSTPPNENSKTERDDWMNLPTSFLTSSNSDRKRKRDEEKKLEREKQQYDPRQCSRELNPYWKDGGDGLPKFKKPSIDDEQERYYHTKKEYSKTSNWRKKTQDREKSEDTKTVLVNESEKVSTSATSTCTSDKSLSEKELNVLAAKLVKAEIMGNTKLVEELKTKLENARMSQANVKSSEMQEEAVLLTHTDAQGRSQPLTQQSEYGESSGYHKKKKRVETHKDGQRTKYFADDDKYSLKQMFEREKYNSVEDQNNEFVKMLGKVGKNDDLDDIFSDNIRKKESDAKTTLKQREKAISEHQRVTKSLDNCNRCIQSDMMLKHLMVSMNETSYLALPPYEPLTEGHCLIIPIRHVPCATQLDENEWSEILDVRKALVRLFKSRNEEVVFFETAVSLHKFPHMLIECIPMPKEDGDMAPIYFKKAIDESESEWAHNKKLVSLKGRDVRKAVPKGLPYFSVSFGMEEGFAHVIEDEQMFPKNFAQEIIGGILDVHHSKWRKPKRQSFDEQSKRVLAFSKDWKEYEPT